MDVAVDLALIYAALARFFVTKIIQLKTNFHIQFV